MGNLTTTLKRFFTNKNTVTILGVIAGVIVLWVFYNMRVNDAINPQRVPVATRNILSREEITKDDIEFVEVSSNFLKKANVITQSNQLIGYMVNVGTSIPQGGMFYKSQVVEKQELPDAITDDIPDGYTLYQLKVTNDTTFANSIMPGNRIDLYLKTKYDDKYVYGPFIESIEVLAVRDSSGRDVFDGSGTRTPAWLLFAVPSDKNSELGDLYEMLMNIESIPDMSLRPVPRNRVYTTEAGETRQANDFIMNIVKEKMFPVPEN